MMYRGRTVIAIVPAYNEELKIGHVVRRTRKTVVDKVVVIDDGSTDRTVSLSREAGAEVISLGGVRGVGAALRVGYTYAREQGFDIAVTLAGNNKDEPAEIARLLDAICDRSCDFVVGSRFLPGGKFGGAMPYYRKLATRMHPLCMSWATGKKLTETTNGFRAIRLECLDDERIDLDQRWLDGYGLEVYLLFKMIVCGYRHEEVPCTKIYPSREVGYTKMPPISGWWDILRPVIFLGLRLRR